MIFGICNPFYSLGRRWGLVLLVVSLYVAVYYLADVGSYFRTRPIAMTLKTQVGKITSINTPERPGFVRRYEIDTIQFPVGTQLEHHLLGKLGVSHDFFLDFNTTLDLKKGGNYRFTVVSDDGFFLKIDGKKVCSFSGGRPMGTTDCNVTLTSGPHRIDLKYFQGYGQLGLRVYISGGDGRRYPLGGPIPFGEFVSSAD